MRTSIIIKSTSKILSASCVLLMAGFTSKKGNYILRGAIQITLPPKKNKKKKRKEKKI